jgi:NAD(P)-dependent dehydrogenase (short-subunit alcohol dehydrogenase family)
MQTMPDRDRKKIALITGANKGIGLETARQLARDHGHTVLLGARDKTRGEDATAKLRAEGLDVQFLEIDPTDDASVTAAAKEVASRFGRLDVLINNAGTRSEAELSLPPSQVSAAIFEETYAINVFGLARVTREFWPLLEQSTAARLVNVSSFVGSLTLQAEVEGLLKDVKSISLTSSKAAVNMMTINYAAQWQHTPHCANAVHPGSVKTPSNPEGELTIEEGAKSSVELAIIGNDGPNGTFSHLGQPIPW